MASDDRKPTYRFDRFALDTRQAALLDENGRGIPLRPKSFTLLKYFLDNAETVVDRDDIMQAVWPGVFVTDDSISQCVTDIRRALGDQQQLLLRTLPRRGYMFAAQVLTTPAPNASMAVRTVPLSDLSLPQPPAGRPLVIVLPFENIGADPDQDYFVGGLIEDLVTDLIRFQDLHVVSPHRQYSDSTARLLRSPEGNSREANSYILSGSVRRAIGQIRVTVQLKDAGSDINLWSDRFDRPVGDLFEIQEELATRIASLLDIQVDQDVLRRARHRPLASLEAYDLCLQGREMHCRVTEADTVTAREMFTRAIAIDPHYASAHAWLAYAVSRGFTLGWGEPRGRAALDPALSFANRAVALEPGSSTSLMRLAFTLQLTGQSIEALNTGRAAVRANPCDFFSRASFGEILSKAGQHDAGVAELRLAISLNPFHPPFWNAALGRALLLAGYPEEALTELRRCAALAPDYRPCHSSTVVACMETGRVEEARAALCEVLRLRPGWRIRDYDGVFGFQREADTARFLTAFRAAGMQDS